MNRSELRYSLDRTALDLAIPHRLVAICLIGWAAAASVFVLFAIASPIRPFITLSFLLIAPGLALVRLLQLDERVLEVPLAIALSLALDAFVAMLLLYANAWSFETIFVLLACLTVGCAIVDLIREYDRKQRERTSSQLSL